MGGIVLFFYRWILIGASIIPFYPFFDKLGFLASFLQLPGGLAIMILTGFGKAGTGDGQDFDNGR
ncbi:hypothetical protein [uncultured Acetatifactor sp.]|uniref:hypothetical protein n=1 Tax=uncultured Acetatifactor sp. TaxID=1671927 RepID=UPI002605FE40|nr:hypothetical protein [uncultured Acetatifactor sp.]